MIQHVNRLSDIHNTRIHTQKRIRSYTHTNEHTYTSDTHTHIHTDDINTYTNIHTNTIHTDDIRTYKHTHTNPEDERLQEEEIPKFLLPLNASGRLRSDR